ncbi:hypothetical protein AALA00_12655 [Lachnospiraceae bacterium 46-15]
MENYETFPEAYEAYYNDNIPFRNQLIRFNNSIDYFLFSQSSNEDVVIGKDDWLFFCSSTEGNPVEQSLGYWSFTEDELEKIADNLMDAKRVLESQGIEFVLFLAPNKETIYRDKLPDYYKVQNEYTSTEQLVDYLKEKTDIRVIYPKQDLLDAREENPDITLYHKLDTHWNHAGAYVGARSLAKELEIEMPSFADIFLEPVVSSSGDLTNMLNITIKNGDIDYDISGINTLKTEKTESEEGAVFSYHTPGGDSRRVFVCRDSYAEALAPNLATQFKDSTWVHAKIFKPQQIFDYNTDIFILEAVERRERELESFRVSSVSCSVENEGERKKISIAPELPKDNLQYVSIFKKRNGEKAFETIQALKAVESPVVLDVPVDETGEICIRVFKDKSSSETLDEVSIKY